MPLRGVSGVWRQGCGRGGIAGACCGGAVPQLPPLRGCAGCVHVCAGCWWRGLLLPGAPLPGFGVDGKRRRPLAVGVRLWACRCQGSLQGALVVKAIRTPAAESLRRYACRAAVAGVRRWRVVPAVGLYWCYLRDAGGQRRPPVAAAPRRGMSVAGRCWGLALAGCAGSGFVLVLPKGCWRSKAAPGGSSPPSGYVRGGPLLGFGVGGLCR